MHRLAALSSTTKTGRPRNCANCIASAFGARPGCFCKLAVKWNVVPGPPIADWGLRIGGTGDSDSGVGNWHSALRIPRLAGLSTQMRPPIISTSCEAMVNPRPVPPYLRVVNDSACVNAANTAACRSLGIPMPVSLTATCRQTSSSVPDSVATVTTISPASVNLIALPTRLTMT